MNCEHEHKHALCEYSVRHGLAREDGGDGDGKECLNRISSECQSIRLQRDLVWMVLNWTVSTD